MHDARIDSIALLEVLICFGFNHRLKVTIIFSQATKLNRLLSLKSQINFAWAIVVNARINREWNERGGAYQAEDSRRLRIKIAIGDMPFCQGGCGSKYFVNLLTTVDGDTLLTALAILEPVMSRPDPVLRFDEGGQPRGCSLLYQIAQFALQFALTSMPFETLLQFPNVFHCGPIHFRCHALFRD